MMPMQIQIQDVMRAGFIKRWNIVNTTRQQTLAEHMFNVAMITHTICQRADLDPSKFVEWALVHDIPEVICGDMPTPTKHRLRERGFDMEELYDEIDPTYADIKSGLDEYAIDLVKAADLIESIWFLWENGAGRHAEQVKCRLEERFDRLTTKMMLPIANACWDTYNMIMNGDIHE